MCLCGSILLSTIWHILNCNTHNLPVSVSSYWPTGVRRCGTRWLVPHQDEDSCFHFLIFVHRIIQHFKFVHLFAMLLRVRWEDKTLLCALNVRLQKQIEFKIYISHFSLRSLPSKCSLTRNSETIFTHLIFPSDRVSPVSPSFQVLYSTKLTGYRL